MPSPVVHTTYLTPVTMQIDPIDRPLCAPCGILWVSASVEGSQQSLGRKRCSVFRIVVTQAAQLITNRCYVKALPSDGFAPARGHQKPRTEQFKLAQCPSSLSESVYRIRGAACRGVSKEPPDSLRCRVPEPKQLSRRSRSCNEPLVSPLDVPARYPRRMMTPTAYPSVPPAEPRITSSARGEEYALVFINSLLCTLSLFSGCFDLVPHSIGVRRKAVRVRRNCKTGHTHVTRL